MSRRDDETFLRICEDEAAAGETVVVATEVPTGRELDALVAERVLGMRQRPLGRDWWCAEDHADDRYCRSCERLRAYSDSDEAAMDVIETVGGALRVERASPGDPWRVWLSAGYGEGATFAEAVARAALDNADRRGAALAAVGA